jgi:nucleoside-diphosphate-sugar epimerase
LSLGRAVTAIGRHNDVLDELESLGVVVIRHDLSEPFTAEDLKRLSCIRTIVQCGIQGIAAKNISTSIAVSTHHLLDAAELIGASRFIYISSASVYSRSGGHITAHENDELPKPDCAETASFIEAEVEVLTRLGRGTVVLRPQCIYGPGDDEFLPYLIRNIHAGHLPLIADGRAVFDPVHVEDVVDAIIASEKGRGSAARVFNISGGDPIEVKEFIDRLSSHIGEVVTWKKSSAIAARTRAKMADIRDNIGRKNRLSSNTGFVNLLANDLTLDIGRAERTLNWSPKIAIRDGLAEAMSDLHKH